MQESNIILGREKSLFDYDLKKNQEDLSTLVCESSFLVIGGAGAIGRAVVTEIFDRNPRILHVVDISENNLVELVRDLRSSSGYISGDFRTFAIDYSSVEFRALVESNGPYDYVLNLSALKHVRSEKDPYTLMRMIAVNVLNVVDLLELLGGSAKKVFCVSSDKAANPVSLMGASKRVMEMFLKHYSHRVCISTCRFANIAFSDGSLLYGFNRRYASKQPLAAPRKIQRYFMTEKESAEMCIMSCLLGNSGDIYVPRFTRKDLFSFDFLARRFLELKGFEAYECESEDEARSTYPRLVKDGKWPCFFFESDTTGEKEIEEFVDAHEKIDWGYYRDIGVVKLTAEWSKTELLGFRGSINELRASGRWSKKELVTLFESTIEGYKHRELGKFLDDRM